MTGPALLTIETLTEVVELQAKVIRKQSEVIAQAEIDFDGSDISALNSEIAEKLKVAL